MSLWKKMQRSLEWLPEQIGLDLHGEDQYLKKYKTLNHEQKKYLHDLLRHPDRMGMDLSKSPLYQQGSDYYRKILSQDPEMMKQFEAPYMREFNEQIVPNIAEQFSGMGARDSSAFQQTMGSASAGLQERLAAMKAGLGMQAAQGGLEYSMAPGKMNLSRLELGLGTPSFGYARMGGDPGLYSQIGSGLGQSMGNILPYLIMSLL